MALRKCALQVPVILESLLLVVLSGSLPVVTSVHGVVSVNIVGLIVVATVVETVVFRLLNHDVLMRLVFMTVDLSFVLVVLVVMMALSKVVV